MTERVAAFQLLFTDFYRFDKAEKALGSRVLQNRLSLIQRHLKLFGDFRRIQSMNKIVDDRADRYTCASQHGSSALYLRLHLYQWASRPVNLFVERHCMLLNDMVSSPREKYQ